MQQPRPRRRRGHRGGAVEGVLKNLAFLRFGPFWSFLDRFEAVFSRFWPFWIVWERFGHPGLPNQTSKSQIRQPYFREPPLVLESKKCYAILGR